MPFNVPTAPALFLGLGARIFINTLSRAQEPTTEPTLPDFVLLGAWQGVGLYYALMEFPSLAFIAAFAIGAKLLLEFSLVPDVVRCAVTLLGVALGVMFTDVLSQFLADGSYSTFGGKNKSSSRQRTRAVSYSRSRGNDANHSRRDRDRVRVSHTDITAPSLDSTSDWIDRTARTPLEREVAVLRARASLADTEKRRYKEERVWALAEGNQARAEQMSWQVKRYRALTHGFNKEADAKLLEGVYCSNSGHRFTLIFIENVANSAKPAPAAPKHAGPTAPSSRPVASGSRPRQSTSGGRHASAPVDRHQYYRSSGSAVDLAVDPPAAGAESRPGPTAAPRRRKISSGNLRSALRAPSRPFYLCISFEQYLMYLDPHRIWLSADVILRIASHFCTSMPRRRHSIWISYRLAPLKMPLEDGRDGEKGK
jgi:hypothetical protein